MCGIFCYQSNNDKNIYKGIKGLKKLEYRGYDSFGFYTENLKTIKETGEVEKFEIDESLKSKVFISHTRWATNGKVVKENSHPHDSFEEKILVVHNGIIENYEKLKKDLEKLNIKFRSETDTEVIPNLIEQNLNKGKNFIEAVKLTCDKLQGRFSFVAHNKETKETIGVRSGSPLITGIDEDSIYISSDVPAFSEFTNKISYIDDNEFIYLKYENSNLIKQFYNLKSLEKIEKRIIEININNQENQKDGYKHYMKKEIMEQKHTLKKIINKKNNSKIQDLANEIKNANSVYFIGCGTAAIVGNSAKYIFHDIANLKTDFEYSSEFKSIQNFINEQTLVVALSQSGETIDTLEALELAKEKGAKTACIVNNENSTIFRFCDISIPVKAGEEVAVASTKCTTNQMGILILLAYASINQLKHGIIEVLNFQSQINDMLNPRFEEMIIEIANRLFHKKHMFLIGKGYNYISALEGALKIKELSYINTQAFHAGELKHGSIALIEEGTPVIALAPKDSNQNDVLTNAHEIKSRGGIIIGLSEEKSEVFDLWIKVPNCKEGNLMAYTIPLQILAYHLATLNNHNPDKPRNLAKSVTVK